MHCIKGTRFPTNYERLIVDHRFCWWELSIEPASSMWKYFENMQSFSFFTSKNHLSTLSPSTSLSLAAACFLAALTTPSYSLETSQRVQWFVLGSWHSSLLSGLGSPVPMALGSFNKLNSVFWLKGKWMIFCSSPSLCRVCTSVHSYGNSQRFS